MCSFSRSCLHADFQGGCGREGPTGRPEFKHPSVYPLKDHVLSTYYVQGTIQNTRTTDVNEPLALWTLRTYKQRQTDK